jgi:hypothetical protein
MKFYGHYGEQAGFVSHFYIRPESRTAYVIAFNTNATTSKPTDGGVVQNTLGLDREIKNYLFSRIFTLFSAPAAPR